MAKIEIQLHGLPSELLSFACRSAEDFEVRLGIVSRTTSFEVKLIEVEECEGIVEGLDEATLVFFLGDQLNLAVSSLSELLDENPETLVFRIGRATNGEIRESVLSGNPLDANAIGIGKRIAGALREITFSGAWVVDPESGERTPSRNHRYTVGAKESAEKGIRLKPIAGWNVVEIGTCK